MNPWRPYPLLRIVPSFIAGLLAERLFDVRLFQPYGLIASILLVLLVINLIPRKLMSYRWRWCIGLAIHCCVFIVGYELNWLREDKHRANYFGRYGNCLAIVEITEPVSQKGRFFKAVAEVKFLHLKDKWISVRGQTMLISEHPKSGRPAEFGDYLLVRADFRPITDNSNPHAFNYSRYMAGKGIRFQAFLGSGDWTMIPLRTTNPIRKFAFLLRDRLLDILRKNRIEGREFAVSAALLLGYVEEIDRELRQEYSATGALHILSVSGMHVGIIYIFLEVLLGFLNRKRWGRMVKALMLLFFIWFYAFLTGLSPSVLRAAAMLSFLLMGKSFNRSPDMYNVLSASLIFILAFDPFLIEDIGFQLSYLAVIGIVVLYKPIYNLYITSNWFPDKIWSIVAVSIAAQLATSPISLFSFHQFPNYFILTNILVVPLSSLIIYTGILTLLAGSLPLISLVAAKLLGCLVWFLNAVIHFIDNLPCSATKGIYIGVHEMLLLYLILILAFFWLTLKHKSLLFFLIVSLIILNSSFLYRKLNRLHSSKFTVYNVRNTALFDVRFQDKSLLMYRVDKVGFANASSLAGIEMLQNNRQANGIKHLRSFWLGNGKRIITEEAAFNQLRVHGNFIQFRDKRVAVVREKVPLQLKAVMKVDFIILSANPNVKLEAIRKVFQMKEIIIDASNPAWKSLQWVKEADSIGVSCHAVNLSGACEIEL